MGTQITDSIGMQALAAMETHAAHLSKVAERLLAEHAEHLPELIAVRPMPTDKGARLELQPRTNQGATQWANALGMTPEETFVEDREGWYQWHVSGDTVVDGVRVHVGACEWVSSEARAARTTKAVSA